MANSSGYCSNKSIIGPNSDAFQVPQNDYDQYACNPLRSHAPIVNCINANNDDIHISLETDHSRFTVATVHERRKDGHSLLNAVVKGMNHQKGIAISKSDLIKKVIDESIKNCNDYISLDSNSTEFNRQMNKYLYSRKYGSAFCEALPVIIAQCLNINLHIVEYNNVQSSKSTIVRCNNAQLNLYLRKTNMLFDCILPRKIQSKNAMHHPDGSIELNALALTDGVTHTAGRLKIYFKNVYGLSKEYLAINETELICHDIVLLVETWCHPLDDFSLKGFVHKNYARNFRHINSRRGSGGLYLFIRESILDGIEFLHNIEDVMAWLRVDASYFGLEKDIYVANCYIVPESSTYFNNPFVTVNNEIARVPKNVDKLICADWNAITNTECDFVQDIEGSDGDLNHMLQEVDHLEIDECLKPRASQDTRPLNDSGRELLNTCKSSGCIIINSRVGKDKGIGKFTRICDKKQEYGVLDYMIASPSLFSKIEDFRIGSNAPDSDHLSLELSLKCNIKHQEKTVSDQTPWTQYDKFIWNKDNIENLKESLTDDTAADYMEAIMSSMSNGDHTDEVASNLDKYIQQACHRSFKVRKSKKPSKCHKHPSIRFWDKECSERRADAIKAGERVETDEDKAKLADTCKVYRACIQRKKRHGKSINRAKLTDAFSKNKSDMWGVLNDLSGDKSNANAPSKKEFFDHFDKLSKPSNDNTFNASFLNTAEKFLNAYDSSPPENYKNSSESIESEILNSNFSKEEVIRAIDRLKTGKSAGVDAVPGDFIKHCKDNLTDVLYEVYNYMLATKTFPTKWSEGIRSSVFKNGDRRNTNNYRGITVLPIFEKIFEIMVYNRLEFINEAFSKIDESNGGFMKGRRTSDNIFILNGLIKKQLLLGKRLYVCFVDFSKAFDRVNRAILFYKLMKGGWSGRLIDTLRDLYKKTHCRLKIDGELSDFIYDTIGVNQGGNASGFLFRKYMSDLSDYLHSEFGVVVGDIIIAHLLWADDLVLISDTLSGIKKQLSGLQKFCSDNHMLINELKTKIMCFGSKDKIEIKFNGYLIEHAVKYKYVGVIVQSVHCAKSDVFSLNYDYLCDKARKALFAAKGKLKSFGLVPCDIYCNIFNAVVRPILTYASDVWGVSAIGRDSIDKFFLRFLKNMLGVKQSTSTLMVIGESGQTLPSIDCRINVAKFANRLKFMDENSFAKQVYNELARLQSCGFRTWCGEAWELVENYKIPPNSDLNKYKHQINSMIKQDYIQSWKTSINNHEDNPGCRTYSKFKIQFQMEPYLTLIDNYALRNSLARFRTSSHRLKVETSRHTKYKTLEELELSKKCLNCNIIEDETHFLLECPRYSKLRHNLFKAPFVDNTVFSNLDNDDKLVYLLNLYDKYHLKCLARFVHESFIVHSDRINLSCTNKTS